MNYTDTRSGYQCKFIMNSAYYPNRVILYSITGMKRFYESKVYFERWYEVKDGL